MILYIIDLVSNNYDELKNKLKLSKDYTILSLSPSSTYFLETNNLKFITFHDLILTKDFRDQALVIYQNFLDKNSAKYTKSFFMDVAQELSYYFFIENILKYINNNSYKEVVYLSDKIIKQSNYIPNNLFTCLGKYIIFNKIIKIGYLNNSEKIDKNILKRYSLSTIYLKIKNKIFKNYLAYDWRYITLSPFKEAIFIQNTNISLKLPITQFKYIKVYEINFNIMNVKSKSSLFKTFLSKKEYMNTLNLKELNKKIFFFQHGSYLYKNIFIKYFEIELADINFVFNDCTKKLFKTLGAKRVESVGSILFNKTIKERKKKYDYLYITQGHDYTGNLQYVDFSNSLHSFDGYELYQRHKSIIKLFGTKFKNKKILIRVHPTVVTTGVYVPFWELAEAYPNITIDVSIPIHNLIEKSKYIISDYFTTEFINRELHYKRDIILFQGAPTPLPEETLEDMKKMFILIDTIDDLKEKVENIEQITRNRKRYDDIIEYYSSKKCDTKKVVTEILKKELK